MGPLSRLDRSGQWSQATDLCRSFKFPRKHCVRLLILESRKGYKNFRMFVVKKHWLAVAMLSFRFWIRIQLSAFVGGSDETSAENEEPISRS